MSTPIGRRIKAPLRAALVEAGKRSRFVRTRSRGLIYARRAQQYRSICARTPVDPKTVVFECYAGRGYACSPRAIYEAMSADPRFDDFRFVWVFRPEIASALAIRGLDVDQPFAHESGPEIADKLDFRLGRRAIEQLARATIVPYSTDAYSREHARASAWVANYIVPVHMRPRDGQTYLQTWHGTPLKRLGCDIALDKSNALYSVEDIHERYRQEGARFSYLLSPSAFATEKLTSAFDLAALGRTDVVLETGYPRNDCLSTVTAAQVSEIKRRLGVAEGKRVVLYAPTFRDDKHSGSVGYTFQAEVDFDALRDRLGPDTVILFRPHYLVANSFDFARYEGFVVDVSAVMDINDLYVVSDALVTDYSSVFFDYVNLDRPIYFYMYDLEQYANELRGFYLDLEELPGPILRNAEELASALSADELDAASWRDARMRAKERFAYDDDGRAAERVIDRVLAPERSS